MAFSHKICVLLAMLAVANASIGYESGASYNFNAGRALTEITVYARTVDTLEGGVIGGLLSRG
eukprot:gene15893-22025_t